VDKAKPFDIPKREVWEAFKKVKANQGAAGVDGQTIADFEADLSNKPLRRPMRAIDRCASPPKPSLASGHRTNAICRHSGPCSKAAAVRRRGARQPGA
jgi:hypothetical protein